MAMINCPECGKEISDKADKCPNCGCPIKENTPQPYQPVIVNNSTPEKKNGSCLKTVLIVIGVFIVIGIIGGIAGGGNDKEEAVEAESEIEMVSAEPEEAPEEEKEPEEQPEESEGPETQEKYNIGDTWENKYILVSYDECGEYASDNQFIQPADGNKFIYATFTFENVGKSDTTVGYWDFDCYADGYACEGAYGMEDSGFTQTLSSGRKITGTVYFEVPKESEVIEFEYSPSFWTSEKIVFVYQ